MVPPIARAAPSGKRLSPADANGLPAWDASSPLVIEAVPAGHEPGIYAVAIAYWPIVNAGGGTMTVVGSFDAVGVGPMSITFQSAGAINTPFIAPRHFMSSGLLPIIITYTPASVSGSPRIYVQSPAEFILAELPESF